MNKKVCAIIITYNFEESFFNCLKSIQGQVNEVIIIDNNSNEQCIEELEKLQLAYKIKIIFNKYNLGIAGALNIGVRYAQSKGYEWILTLDDDSEASLDMVDNMIKTYESLNDKNIGIVCPNIFDLNINEYCANQYKDFEFITKCIQSGAMIKAEAFDRVGYFNEDLFIYYVDDEFCERLIKNSSKILRINKSILQHRDGIYLKRKFLMRKFNYNARNNLSIYYRARNNIYMMKNYKLVYVKENIKDLIKIIIYSSSKRKNLKFYFKGIYDALLNKYGIYEKVHL